VSSSKKKRGANVGGSSRSEAKARPVAVRYVGARELVFRGLGVLAPGDVLAVSEEQASRMLSDPRRFEPADGAGNPKAAEAEGSEANTKSEVEDGER